MGLGHLSVGHGHLSVGLGHLSVGHGHLSVGPGRGSRVLHACYTMQRVCVVYVKRFLIIMIIIIK